MITTFGTTRQSLITLEYWLKDLFSKYSERNLAIALVRNLDDIKSFVKTQNSRDFSFPYIGLTIATYSLDLTRGGGRPDSFLRLSKDSTGKTAILDRMPVTLGIGARFVSDSLDDVLILCHALAKSFPSVSFRYQYEEFSHYVNIKVDPEYTIPTASLSSPGDSFQMETTFQLSFLEGDMREMPSIKSIHIMAYDSNRNIVEKQISDTLIESVKLGM